MASGKADGSVRIIGGQWRGRRLQIPAGTEVRPTPDRVRETLFNWLGPLLAGADCLDLFAGTGVLGFEALSRGAATVTFVESDRRLIAALENAKTALGADGAAIVRADAETWLQAAVAARRRFRFVALDPPYRVAVEPLLVALAPLLAADGVVYVERPAVPGLPAADGFRWHRRRRAGRIEFGLAVASPHGDVAAGPGGLQ